MRQWGQLTLNPTFMIGRDGRPESDVEIFFEAQWTKLLRRTRACLSGLAPMSNQKQTSASPYPISTGGLLGVTSQGSRLELASPFLELVAAVRCCLELLRFSSSVCCAVYNPTRVRKHSTDTSPSSTATTSTSTTSHHLDISNLNYPSISRLQPES